MQFYMMPKDLISGEAYQRLSIEARVLYMLMLDRTKLSEMNNWRDREGKIYIYYTLEETGKVLGCGHDKASRVLRELEKFGGGTLITRVRQGQGHPARIYVRENVFSDNQTADIEKPRTSKSGSLDIGKSDGNHNDVSEKNFNFTDPSIMNWKECVKELQEELDYLDLCRRYSVDEADMVVELIADVLCSTVSEMKVGAEMVSYERVKARFLKLNKHHIAYVLDSIRNMKAKIHNVKGFLITALYNAPLTMELHYQLLLQQEDSESE